jgi:hypothetical protein
MGRQARERLHPLYELLRAEAASMKAGASIRYKPTKWLRLASARRDAHSSHGCLLSDRSGRSPQTSERLQPQQRHS